MSRWRGYERHVATVAPDIMRSITGTTKKITVAEDVRVPGRNASHQVDVLARAGRLSLFIECKDHSRPLSKDTVSTTLYNFLDVCLGNPKQTWALALVAPTDTPMKARLPAARPEGIFAAPPNLVGRSVATTTHFVYFSPPSGLVEITPFFLTDDGVPIFDARMPGPADAGVLWEQLTNPLRSLPSRVDAGLGLATVDPENLARDHRSNRTVIHGLMHLGRVQEATYMREIFDRDRPLPPGAEVEDSMMRFLLARSRYPQSRRAGRRPLGALERSIGKVALLEEVSLTVFIAPVIARWGGDGLGMLGKIEPKVAALEIEEGPYFEVLRLVRIAQIASSSTERDELLEAAGVLTRGLPIWNRSIAERLLTAVDAKPASLHGIEVPFDIEEWETPGSSQAR